MRVDPTGAASVTSVPAAGARGETRAPQPGQERPSGVSAGDERAYQPDPERAELTKAVNQMNETLQVFKHNLRLSIHEETKHIQIQVVDIVSNEVISEFPPKKLLDQLGAIQRMVGLLLDKQG